MSRENVEIVQRFLDAQRRDDVPAALACLDPNVEFIALRAKTEGVYRGHAGIENFRADTLDSFEKFEPHFALRDLGQRVLAWGTIHVQGRRGGVEIDIPSGGIFDFRGGKISRWKDFGSKERALEAVGLSE